MGNTYYVSALNIKMHPHSPEKYIEAFQIARRRKISRQYLSDRHAMIGFFYPNNRDAPLEGYEGQLLSFVDINPDDPWLNTDNGKLAEPDDLEGLNIPSHLRPGMRQFYFAFFPKTHRLVFESKNTDAKTLGPNSAKKAFERILNSKEVSDIFGPIDVIVEPKIDALEDILGLHKLKKLVIHITRPNADDTGDAEIEIMRRLQQMHAQSHTEEYKARKGEALELDDDARTFAEVGSHNGYVESYGRNAQNEPVYESTEKHPLKERGAIDGGQLYSESFWNRALEIVKSVTGR